MKTFTFKGLLVILPVFLINLNSYAYESRYVLTDRNIKSICIQPFIAKESNLGNIITEKFYTRLKNNNSGIRVMKYDSSQDCDSIMSGEIKDYISDTKTNTISDSLSYDIVEQQIKVSIEIEINEFKTKDILWRRRASKYKTQSWLEFTRSRIADNNVELFFYVPSQLATSIKKQYNEKEFIDKNINDVVIDLSKDLVKLN